MTHLLIVGGTRQQRIAAARTRGGAPTVALDAATLPFVRFTPSMISPRTPRVIAIDDIERACPNAQAGGARLVLTQSTYLVQKLLDLLEARDRVIVTADRTALERNAGDALQARGPWAWFEVVDLDRDTALFTTEDTEDAEVESIQNEVYSSVSPVSSVVESLIRAYATTSTEERIQRCTDAVAAAGDNPVAHLALASACREARDMDGARAALDRAAALAPDWEAVHYESGKFWLGYDDMEKARDAFQRACDLMPTFSAAFSNLGATLGELDQPDAALAAFRQALANDPLSFTVLNNIGVVSRELGRLDESETAFRRVIELAPTFVFGYYNLGHTLFLGEQFGAALAAYEEGQRRDPEKNPRQGCRLAVIRFANGDAAGAERDLWQFADRAPAAEREDLLLEVYEIAQALLAQRPELGAHRHFVERIGEAIARNDEPRG
ncbi:MAG TPA: tetratricopeptide repeat protein [Vicinamibacterales bacterium]|nr:tetratricopeptide repeat protein [Vicinamibacterales bacterium]